MAIINAFSNHEGRYELLKKLKFIEKSWFEWISVGLSFYSMVRGCQIQIGRYWFLKFN